MSTPRPWLIALSWALLALPATAIPSTGGRDVTYRMTSTGLLIEVDGVDLAPKAEAVKTSKGWIVALSLRVTAKDQHTHKLLDPEKGPLMVSVEVQRSGKTDKILDVRKGDGEQTLAAGEATTVTRKVDVPIWGSQRLTLNVGLWGLAKDAEERRPVKKLFQVRMVAGAKKPVPVITPPD
jgi:hypothetical protein